MFNHILADARARACEATRAQSFPIAQRQHLCPDAALKAAPEAGLEAACVHWQPSFERRKAHPGPCCMQAPQQNQCNHSLGQAQELGLKVAHDQCGALYQVGHLKGEDRV